MRRRIERTAREMLEAAGYGRIDTPVFEDTELFARGVGESTDIVQKQMFSFEDQGGRSLTLRPEATASLCRAYLEHGMHKLAQPVKLWASGPFFRHERPQAGRYRQFSQIDAEVIGSDSPLVDAELIVLLHDLLAELGVEGVRLRLGSLGSPGARVAYLEELRAYLRSHERDLSKDVRERIDINPLRAFDADHEGTRKVMAEAPTMLDHLGDEDAEHFATVRKLLEREGVAYDLDPTLVRGLDYYTRTVFEFESDRLGAQSGLGGGGRYDGLIEQLGGPPTPANGWALGVERVALALGEEEARGGCPRLHRRRRAIARPRVRPGDRAPARGPRRGPRPWRPRGQGPDEAGGPGRGAIRADPRGRRGARPARHALGRAAGDRSRPPRRGVDARALRRRSRGATRLISE